MPDGTAQSSWPLRIIACGEIDSTNSEALRRALGGETGPVWITAEVQTRGRGRSGRGWTSPRGNLYATLLFEPGCGPARVHELSLVAGVAVHDALLSLGPLSGLRLKWPNDVLIGGAKVAGILSESVSGPSGVPLAIVGIGINLVSSPAGGHRLATHLADHGGRAIPASTALQALHEAVSRWLAVWQEGLGFARVRTAWLERAGPIGEELAVNTGNGRVEGSFAGLDSDGSLLLTDAQGRRQRFTFGDVTVLPPVSGV